MRSRSLLLVALPAACTATLLVVLLAVGFTAAPLAAQNNVPFKLEMNGAPERKTTEQGGKTTAEVTVRFTISKQGEDTNVNGDYLVRILEEGVKVKEVPLPKAKASEDMSVVLAMDTSGSMESFGRMDQAKKAATTFFNNLPAKADTGLILFDHEMKKKVPLTKDRSLLLAEVQRAVPDGGTAYLDACLEGIDMLKGVTHTNNKVLVVMTDGMDLNSKTRDLKVVTQAAKKAGVKIYTIGIGEPGKQQPVTTVLTLDISGSMNSPADATEKNSKIKALITAADRFIDLMPDNKKAHVQSTIMLFSDTVKFPDPSKEFYHFTGNKNDLSGTINRLLSPEEKTKLKIVGGNRIEAKGETAILDATYDAIKLLEVENPPGKRAVIAMTDGIDNSSRRRVEEVIAAAKEANIPLHVLGFGQKGEIDEAMMMKMAKETGGKYYPASKQKDLMKIFENLSIQLHDDGIDEAALTELARETGGKYYPAKDVNQLKFIVEQVTVSIQRKEYEITFPSRFQKDDGLQHPVSLQLVQLNGDLVGDSASDGTVIGQSVVKSYQNRGLIMAQMSPVIYLGLLASLGMLLVLPVGLRKLSKGAKK